MTTLNKGVKLECDGLKSDIDEKEEILKNQISSFETELKNGLGERIKKDIKNKKNIQVTKITLLDKLKNNLRKLFFNNYA